MIAKGTDTEDLRRQVDAVVRASRVLVGVVARSVAEVEDLVSLPQFRVLVIIASRGSVNLGEVAEGLGVHPSNATRTVDKLVVAGLVRRSDDPADRRYLVLNLTSRGHDVVERVMNHRRTSIAVVMDNMAPSRRRTLASVLGAFAEAAGEQAGDERLTCWACPPDPVLIRVRWPLVLGQGRRRARCLAHRPRGVVVPLTLKRAATTESASASGRRPASSPQERSCWRSAARPPTGRGAGPRLDQPGSEPVRALSAPLPGL